MKLPSEKVNFPVASGSSVCFPKEALCPMCKTTRGQKPHSMAIVNIGAMLMTNRAKGAGMMSDDLDGFLRFIWHGRTRSVAVTMPASQRFSILLRTYAAVRLISISVQPPACGHFSTPVSMRSRRRLLRHKPDLMKTVRSRSSPKGIFTNQDSV